MFNNVSIHSNVSNIELDSDGNDYCYFSLQEVVQVGLQEITQVLEISLLMYLLGQHR